VFIEHDDKPMKICIVSDSHDRAEPLSAAVKRALSAGAQAVIHCGDLVGANTLRASLKLGIPIHVVHGNNLGDSMAMYRMMSKSGGLFTYHGQDAELELGGRRIFATHFPTMAWASPAPGITTWFAAVTATAPR
jgi:uncharacterized protein